MSRKTIRFNMPQAEAARPSAFDASLAPDTPADDRWIHARQADAPAPPPGMSIDVAAERSFAEAVTLSLALPTMLGWFWFSNAIERYRRTFAP